MELPDDDTFYTPESIAWKLYQDDNDTPLSSQILGFGPPGEINELEYNFELLLSVFFEMLIHMLKIDLLTDDTIDSNDSNELQPNFENFDMELYYPIIRSKFKKISYLVTVETFSRDDDKDYLLEVVKDRYSRVILRHNPDDEHYFNKINSVEYYDFIPCAGFASKKYLRDIFAICTINSNMYRVRFDNIKLNNNKF